MGHWQLALEEEGHLGCARHLSPSFSPSTPLCLPHPAPLPLLLWRCLATRPSCSASAAPTALGLFLTCGHPLRIHVPSANLQSKPFISFPVPSLL